MPLAEVGSVVSSVFEQLPHQGELARVEMDFGAIVVVHDADFGRITPGEERGPRRNAKRIGAVRPREDHAVRRQAIHVRRMNVLGADAIAGRFGELLVGGNDQDVRLYAGGRGN